jgi:MerR family copper efflux transcriptional regulator
LAIISQRRLDSIPRYRLHIEHEAMGAVLMQIGEVAAGAGVNIQTLRYYERRGLLAKPRRSGSGYREYEPQTVQLVRFIKRAQELGFTLREIEDLIELRQSPRRGAEVRALAAAKVSDIDHRLRLLRAMRSALGGLVEACECEGGAPICPIIEALDASTTAGSRADAPVGKE